MKVGTKMIGNWGAMLPLSYGVITKIDFKTVFASEFFFSFFNRFFLRTLSCLVVGRENR